MKMDNHDTKSQIDIKKRAYKYALEIIKLFEHLDKQDLTVRVISHQLLRSATSVGANLVEGQASSSKKEFINFLNHSLKSANESKFWLALLRDSGKASKVKINDLLSETSQLAKILASSILTLKGKR
jgi:four helix bundle protein